MNHSHKFSFFIFFIFSRENNLGDNLSVDVTLKQPQHRKTSVLMIGSKAIDYIIIAFFSNTAVLLSIINCKNNFSSSKDVILLDFYYLHERFLP